MGINVLDIPLRSPYAEMLHQQGLHVAHEGAAATDDHLDQQRLAFLESHAAITADRLVTPLKR